MLQVLSTRGTHPKRNLYCYPSVWVHAAPGVVTDDTEYHQARFLVGSPYCGKLGVPFVQEPPHRHHGHDLLIVTHGTCQLLIEDSETCTLTPGTVLIIPGGIGHRRVAHDNSCCCGIEISPDYFLDYLDVPELAPLAQPFTQRVLKVENEIGMLIGKPLPLHLVRDHRAYRSFLNLFEECLTAYNQVTPFRAHLIHTFGAHFALFLLSLLPQLSSLGESPSTTQRMMEIKRWLDRHFTEEISIPQLAQKASLSPNWFSTAFRKTIGVSPKTYLLSLRLKHAAYLLEETDYSITEIAHRVGYNDLANFIRAFESHYQINPRAYRHQHRLAGK